MKYYPLFFLLLCFYFSSHSVQSQRIVSRPWIPTVDIYQQPNRDIQIELQFQQNGIPLNIKDWNFKMEILQNPLTIKRDSLWEGQGISQVDSATIRIRIEGIKLVRLLKKKYIYHLLTFTEKGSQPRMTGFLDLSDSATPSDAQTGTIIINYQSTRATTVGMRVNGQEVDPTVPEFVKKITESQIERWNQAHTTLIYQSNFSENTDGFDGYVNGRSSFQRTNNQLSVTQFDDAVGFGEATKFKQNMLLHVSVDFVKTGADIIVSPCYGCGTTSYFILNSRFIKTGFG